MLTSYDLNLYIPKYFYKVGSVSFIDDLYFVLK